MRPITTLCGCAVMAFADSDDVLIEISGDSLKASYVFGHDDAQALATALLAVIVQAAEAAQREVAQCQ